MAHFPGWMPLDVAQMSHAGHRDAPYARLVAHRAPREVPAPLPDATPANGDLSDGARDAPPRSGRRARRVEHAPPRRGRRARRTDVRRMRHRGATRAVGALLRGKDAPRPIRRTAGRKAVRDAARDRHARRSSTSALRGHGPLNSSGGNEMTETAAGVGAIRNSETQIARGGGCWKYATDIRPFAAAVAGRWARRWRTCRARV
jgi:hypothetical protein